MKIILSYLTMQQLILVYYMAETSSGQEQNQSFFGGGSPRDEVGLDIELHGPRTFLRSHFDLISVQKKSKKT